MIVGQTLTEQDDDDPLQVTPLLDRIDIFIALVAADCAPTNDTIAAHGDRIELVIPPRSIAVLSRDWALPHGAIRHLEMIMEAERMAWQKATDYGQRSLVETTMDRYKAFIEPQCELAVSTIANRGGHGYRSLDRIAAWRRDRIQFRSRSAPTPPCTAQHSATRPAPAVARSALPTAAPLAEPPRRSGHSSGRRASSGRQGLAASGS